MNLIILTKKDATGEFTYRVSDHRAEHIRDVLHAEVGDTLEVGLLNGPGGTATIVELHGTSVILECRSMTSQPEPLPEVDLICALPRPQTLKKVLITSACMGVRRLHFIRANRVEKSYFQSPLLEPSKYEPYLLEGLSQGKLTRMPKVAIHDRFRRFIEDTLPELEKSESTCAIKLLADVDAGAGLDGVVTRPVARVMPAVGPEGGWVPFELDLMQASGFQPFRLGPWILRVETAVAVLLGQFELVRSQLVERP